MAAFSGRTIAPFPALLFNETVITLIHRINILMAGLMNAARRSLRVCCCSIHFPASAVL